MRSSRVNVISTSGSVPVSVTGPSMNSLASSTQALRSASVSSGLTVLVGSATTDRSVVRNAAAASDVATSRSMPSP